MNYMKIDVKKIFTKNIIFGEYSRSGVIYYSKDLQEVKYLNQIGWRYNECSKGFRLNPPSVSLCDITDCKKICQYHNVIFNLAFFWFLTDLKDKNKLNDFIDTIISKKDIYYKNFKYHISIGPVLEAEFKIEGLDNRIEKLRSDIAEAFINSSDYKKYYAYAKSKIKNNYLYNKKGFDYKLAPKELKRFYEDLIGKNMPFNKDFKISDVKYELDLTLLDNLYYDILLFVPNGCYKFIPSFINVNNYKKVMFLEVHIDKEKPGSLSFYSKSFKNKKVLIVDSVYSGKTLLHIKSIIEEAGGTPILLGVYPKNRGVINILDYALITNKLFSRESLENGNIDFFEKIYINSLKGDF